MYGQEVLFAPPTSTGTLNGDIGTVQKERPVWSICYPYYLIFNLTADVFLQYSIVNGDVLVLKMPSHYNQYANVLYHCEALTIPTLKLNLS